MLTEPQNQASLKLTFTRVLGQILDGTLPSAPDGNGLDEITNAALNDLAAHRDKPSQYTLAAYDALAGQLSGAHARDAEAQFLDML